MIDLFPQVLEPFALSSDLLLLLLKVCQVLELHTPQLVLPLVDLLFLLLGVGDLLPNGHLHDAELFLLLSNQGHQLGLFPHD